MYATCNSKSEDFSLERDYVESDLEYKRYLLSLDLPLNVVFDNLHLQSYHIHTKLLYNFTLNYRPLW